MSEAVIITFQTQLSNVLETILKSAMYEITRLVEDSLLEEVGHGKQEVEVLRRRLQLSELKLKERECEKSRRGKCTDCGRSVMPNDESQHGGEEGHVMKQEDGPPGKWSSCGREASEAEHEILSSGSDREFKVIELDVVQPADLVKKEVITDPSTSQDTEPRIVHSFSGDHQKAQRESFGVLSDCLLSEPVTKQLDMKNRKSGQSNQDEGPSRNHPIRTQTGPDFKSDHTKPSSSQHQSASSPQSSTDSLNTRHHTGATDSVLVKQEVVVVYPQWREEDTPRENVVLSPSKVNRSRVDIAPQTSPSCPQAEGVMKIPQPQPMERHEPVRKHNPALAQPIGVTSSNLASGDVDRNASFYKSSATRPTQLHHHQRVYTGGRRIGSIHLGRGYAQMAGIKTHLSHHAAKAPHSCNQCGKGFSHLSHLRAHQQTHTGERPFCCALCGRSFTKLSNLKAHCRVHTGERPYICSDCGKRFTQKCNLKRHQRIHTAHL
ncbi:histone-lysine N-methyltransferase PRDM9 [Clupea harengus]|uniref:Histone-lysine N-methyltransferase PRDM9 n=1 Tax=Clupea harengus TaxID=7950 RepID=A0A6P3W8R9_CLUHA|nr:histone-lysine N-methyltransferase PRDM9 [Clupea harengus]